MSARLIQFLIRAYIAMKYIDYNKFTLDTHAQ